MLEDMAKDAKIDMKKIIDSMPKHLPTYDEKCLPTTPPASFPLKPRWYAVGGKFPFKPPMPPPSFPLKPQWYGVDGKFPLKPPMPPPRFPVKLQWYGVGGKVPELNIKTILV